MDSKRTEVTSGTMQMEGRATSAPTARSARFWAATEDELLLTLGTTREGLDQAEAERRLVSFGPNRVGGERHASDRVLLIRQFSNPIMLLLLSATALSLFLGDGIDAGIIFVIILASAGLGFTQERGAVHAVRALQSSVQVHADVLRDGARREIAIDDIVPGDIVILDAGDVIPGDCRVLDADALTVDQSALTGESYPRHKTPGTDEDDTPLNQRHHSLFLGTHVVSGSGTALVCETGPRTQLGSIGESLTRTEPPTSFERGLRSFGFLLMRVGAALIVAVFVINIVLHRPVLESLLFSLALAVGITPQLLPAIVTVTLSQGARAMARAQVVVKRLSSIEDLGSMDTLVVDKTGTLTEGAVRLEGSIDVGGEPSPSVAALAWLNAHHQNGFTNPIDTAILTSGNTPSDVGRKRGEVPYDFERQRLSVALDIDGTRRLVSKGSFRSIRSVCTTARRRDGSTVLLAAVDDELDALFRRLSGDGLRVLAVATRDLTGEPDDVSPETEHDMVMEGLLTFADPVKADVGEVVEKLARAGVSVRMLTGDNQHVAAHVASLVGLRSDAVIVGRQIDEWDDEHLDESIRDIEVFAEVEPAHKERIIRALSRAGHTTGFLGDGINDAMALRTADVGISVDTAVDVAKESAAIVLLTKDLAVLLDGVRRGRQTFANTLKYVFVTTSANFGNMVSMAGSTAILPFVPLLPRQILLLNFLSDIPGTTIAADSVDEELVDRPTTWNIQFIRRFMIVFGLISSIFDYLTFAVLRLGFDADATTFRTGWFLVSVGTELLVMLILRTRRPFLRSRPGNALVASSVSIAAITLALPFTPLAEPLGLDPLSLPVLGALALVLVGYVVVTEIGKHVFYATVPSTPAPVHAPSQVTD